MLTYTHTQKQAGTHTNTPALPTKEMAGQKNKSIELVLCDFRMRQKEKENQRRWGAEGAVKKIKRLSEGQQNIS